MEKFGAPNLVVRLKRASRPLTPVADKLGSKNGGWRNVPVRSMMRAKRV